MIISGNILQTISTTVPGSESSKKSNSWMSD